MERRVKERLIGAAVLMAAAVILIPEMLSGPASRESRPEPHPVEAPAMKTFTIDLEGIGGEAPSAAPLEDRAPPPEAEVAPVIAAPTRSSDQAFPESSAAPPAEKAADAKPAPPLAKPPVVEAPTRVPPVEERAAKSTQKPLEPAPNVPMTGGWAVQIGSYSRRDTAERLSAELRSAGHSAFVMPVQSQGATLYRVRVGPMKDRSGAESALVSLKAKSPGATVVSHP